MTWPHVNEVPPLDPETLLALLPLAHDTWSHKRAVVCAIGARPGGDWWTSGEVAGFIGRTEGRARQLLRELVDDRVLWRDGGASPKAAKRFWIELNPNVLSWRGVEWKVSRFQLHALLSRHHERSIKEPIERLIGNPLGARSTLAIARLRDARSVGPDLGLSVTPRATDNRPPPGGGSRAIDARSRSVVRALHGRAIFSPSPQEEPSSWDSEDDGDHLTPGGFAEGVDESTLDAVCAAVVKCAVPGPNGRRFMADKHRGTIVALVHQHGPGRVLDAVEAVADRGNQVPYLVRDIQGWLALERAETQRAQPEPEAEAPQRQAVAASGGAPEALPEAWGFDRSELTSARAAIAEARNLTARDSTP